MARRTASVIKSGFIWSSVHHFTSATLRRFHRRRLLHATDFFQATIFTVKGGVSVMPKNPHLAAHFRLFVLAVTSPDDFGDVDGLC